MSYPFFYDAVLAFSFDLSVLTTLVAVHEELTSGLTMHTCNMHSQVLTGEKHRRHGLSSALVHAALAAFDAAGGEVCSLGTGSPFAARTYAREGFVRVAGGLESDGPKGYVCVHTCAPLSILNSVHSSVYLL